MAEFKDRLRELRKERGLTQKDICSKFNILPSTCSAWESGREPSYSMLIALGQLFNVTTDYLLGVSDERKPQVIEKPLDLSTIAADDMTRELLRRWR